MNPARPDREADSGKDPQRAKRMADPLDQQTTGRLPLGGVNGAHEPVLSAAARSKVRDRNTTGTMPRTTIASAPVEASERRSSDAS